MNIKNYLVFILSVLGLSMLLFLNSCSKDDDLDPEMETTEETTEEINEGPTIALNCVLTPSEEPILVEKGMTTTLKGSPGNPDDEDKVEYTWTVSDTTCFKILESTPNGEVTIQAVGNVGCSVIVDVEIKEIGRDRYSSCNTLVEVQ